MKIQKGFTLIEIGVVMAIVSLLLVGALSALRIQTERSRFADARTALEESKAALLAFSSANRRLPCPADPEASAADFGKESCSPAKERGLIPWKTLGIQGTDPWGQYLSYQVVQTFTTSGWTKSSSTSLSILDTTSAGTTAVDEGAVAFAVWSHGPNGHEAINAQGVQQAAATDDDERSNAPNATPAPKYKVIIRAHSDNFDDQGIWVSKYVFFKQALDSGWDISGSSSSSSGG